MADHNNHWLKHFWRPACAVVYLFICLFDFVVMPSIVEYNSENDKKFIVVLNEVHKLQSTDAQIALINKTNIEEKSWQPLTLMGGGMFHVAFGALLTGAAVTRGLEKKALVEKG